MLAGDCVGAIAAQAFAEPLMQMNLSSIHMQHAAAQVNPINRLRALLDVTATDLIYYQYMHGGIETRLYLMHELYDLYNRSGETIDMRHVSLVADMMLKNGELKGFNRHDVDEDISCVKAAAFEQTLKILSNAAAKV